jgi:hypothetical protein
MLRRRALTVGIATLSCTALFAGCGGSNSANVDVVLVDRSKSFCPRVVNCTGKMSAIVSDRLAVLSKHGGSLHVLLIGNDSGAAVQAVENERCSGLLRGAAACFPKPTLVNAVFGKSGTQAKAALAKINADIRVGIDTPTVTGTSIFDAIMEAEPHLNDRRISPGERQLVIVSDMIEDSDTDLPPLTCVNVGKPEQNRHVIAVLRDQGRLPDLRYTVVEVFGANAVNVLNRACRASFWKAYFSRTGAELHTYQGL